MAQFVDKVRIFVQAGHGGNGCMSFRREKYIAAGGPDGGDGGHGGSVVLRVDTGMTTLMDFRYKRKYTAQPGGNGQGSNMKGHNGENLIISVPLGTVVRDAETGEVIHDMSDQEDFVLAKGGRGGWGNQRFATPTRQTPQFAKAGLPGKERTVLLELKLLADVGLVGFPNVGKSTLLSVATKARPKIANYHFTTLFPNLGVVFVEEGVSFVMADIPGIIEGAADGAGLGHDFLRHIDRCRLLIHVDRAGNKSVRLYDEERPHLVTRFIDKTGGITKLSYDRHGQPVTVSKGDRRSELSYEGLDLVSWHEDGRQLGCWRYDARGRLTERGSLGHRREFYHYDALDRLLRIDARDGNVIHLGYDSYDSITEARDDRRHIRMGYNSVGSLTWREESGRRVSFRYDGMDRLREVINEAGSGYLFSRDLAGNISSERDYGGIERAYQRDGCGRVTRIDRPGGRSTSYTYDAAGRVVTASYHDGTREEYGYDRNGLMASAANGDARVLFERDPVGRVIKETMGLPGGDTLMPVVSVDSEYNGYGERTRVRSSLGADMELSYDRLGLVGGIKATVERPEADEDPANGSAAPSEEHNIQSWESSILRDDAGRETERFATGGIKIIRMAR